MGPTQPPIQCVPSALSPGVKQPDHYSDQSFHLVPKLRMHETIPLGPPDM
jgi:hypothetical protein